MNCTIHIIKTEKTKAKLNFIKFKEIADFISVYLTISSQNIFSDFLFVCVACYFRFTFPMPI